MLPQNNCNNDARFPCDQLRSIWTLHTTNLIQTYNTFFVNAISVGIINTAEIKTNLNVHSTNKFPMNNQQTSVTEHEDDKSEFRWCNSL